MTQPLFAPFNFSRSCAYFNTSKGCKNRENCTYAHNLNICRHYAKGYCRLGISCKFYHGTMTSQEVQQHAQKEAERQARMIRQAQAQAQAQAQQEDNHENKNQNAILEQELDEEQQVKQEQEHDEEQQVKQAQEQADALLAQKLAKLAEEQSDIALAKLLAQEEQKERGNSDALIAQNIADQEEGDYNEIGLSHYTNISNLSESKIDTQEASQVMDFLDVLKTGNGDMPMKRYTYQYHKKALKMCENFSVICELFGGTVFTKMSRYRLGGASSSSSTTTTTTTTSFSNLEFEAVSSIEVAKQSIWFPTPIKFNTALSEHKTNIFVTPFTIVEADKDGHCLLLCVAKKEKKVWLVDPNGSTSLLLARNNNFSLLEKFFTDYFSNKVFSGGFSYQSQNSWLVDKFCLNHDFSRYNFESGHCIVLSIMIMSLLTTLQMTPNNLLVNIKKTDYHNNHYKLIQLIKAYTVIVVDSVEEFFKSRT